MVEIDDYKDSKELFIVNNNYSKHWKIVLILISLFLTVIFFIPFNIYKNYNAFVSLEENEAYINLMLERRDFPIDLNNKLYIKGVLYNYSIKSISNNIVKIKIDLDENLKIQDNVLLVSLLKDRTTIINILNKKITEGFGL